MRTLILAMLLAAADGAVITNAAQGTQGAIPGSEVKSGTLRINLTVEDQRPAAVKLELQTKDRKVIKTISEASAGAVDLSLADVLDGDYYLCANAAGHAGQWRRVAVKQGKSEPGEVKVAMFRTRYVVLRYAFNPTGGREFSGPGVTEGRAAVAHWSNVPYLQRDWQIWQKSTGKELFGDTPFLEFHRYSKGYGFAKAPAGVAFDDLKEAPEIGSYRCENTKAEKGVTLFCRVAGDHGTGLGFGKLMVEEVTETPPAGVKVIERR